MRRVVFAVWAFLLAPVISAQEAPVRGRVVHAITGEALPGALIRLASEGRSDHFLTDDRGEFTIALPKSTAELRVSRAGYAVAVRTGAELRVQEPLEIRLARGAAISGRVTDVFEAPVAGATVQALRIGDATAGPAVTTSTNDLGEYRLGGLPEGRYAVTVSEVRAVFTGQAVNNTPATPVADAPLETVTVRSGDDLSAIDFRLPPQAPCQPAGPASAVVAGSGAIRGRVMAVGGYPVDCASVQLRQIGAVPRTTQTDSGGRYLFTGVSPGEYNVEARKTGYAIMQYGQERAAQLGRIVRVRARENVEDIDIVLPRGSAIAGTLVDERGDPVEGVPIRALQLRALDGRMMALGIASAVTDDRGMYRLFGLLPGRYLVAAMPGAAVADSQALGYATTYSPGTSDIASATAVPIEIGRDMTGVDVVRTRARVATVRGTANDSNGRPVAGSVLLSVSFRSGGILTEPQPGPVRSDGSFSISNIPAGDYVVQAISGDRDRGAEFGMQYVTVADVDPLPIDISTASPSVIEGRLIVEGGAANPTEFEVVPFPSDYDRSYVIGTGFQTSWSSGGSFRLGSVTGPRRIVLLSAPPGWYLKSATLDGREIIDEPYDFGLDGRTFTGLEVVVSNNGAAVSGTIRDAETSANYSVLLYSTDRNKWFRNSRHMKLARPTQNGDFRIEGVPAGDYFIVAVDALDANPAFGEWQDPAVLDALSIDARRLTLAEGDRQEATVALVRR